VAAPSRLIRASGDRVKTDLRDAQQLARLLHLGEIVSVTVPSVEQEAARDLVRAREDCRGDLMSSRQRISKLLLRHGIVYSGGEAWTGKHEHWLRRQRFDTPGLQMAYDAAFDAMLATVDRRERLDHAIAHMAAHSQFTPVADRLQCVRGISTLTAFALAVEIGDWDRFTGRSIGAYHGLVPSEYSSGSSRVQGGLTKTGKWACAPPTDRGSLASPQALPARTTTTTALGNCHSRSTSPWPCSQPSAQRSVDSI